jgi:hypothetical protein
VAAQASVLARTDCRAIGAMVRSGDSQIEE